MIKMTCCTRIVGHFRTRVIQCHARAHYRMDRWRASRVRRKWVKRENEYRKEMEMILRGPHLGGLDGEKRYSHIGIKPESIQPLWVSERRRDRKSGVSVLSPQRLSERLSENALAREAVGESDLELAQYLKDERIALFLQNDEFITELRSNQDFMSALQEEQDGDSEADEDYDQTYRGRKSKGGESGGGGGGVVAPLDDATFKERLANMGKASRKKFAQVAKVFSRGKRGTVARSLLPNVGGSASTNGKDLLMSSDPLIDEYEDERIQSTGDPVLSTSPRQNP